MRIRCSRLAGGVRSIPIALFVDLDESANGLLGRHRPASKLPRGPGTIVRHVRGLRLRAYPSLVLLYLHGHPIGVSSFEG